MPYYMTSIIGVVLIALGIGPCIVGILFPKESRDFLVIGILMVISGLGALLVRAAHRKDRA
jgi:hypothetical protein